MTASISQRNALVENHLWCIDSVMEQNGPWIKSANLDPDDVYQSLALRLIWAVGLYDPGMKSECSLVEYIFINLRCALRDCYSAWAMYGFLGVSHYLPNAVVSMNELERSDPYWEMRIIA